MWAQPKELRDAFQRACRFDHNLAVAWLCDAGVEIAQREGETFDAHKVQKL